MDKEFMMLFRKLFIAGVSILMSGSFAFAQESASAPKPKVKIGAILPLTGAFARYGSKIQSAISAYDKDRASFVYGDEGCDPKMAMSAYKKLSQMEGIRLFLGPWCGSPQSVVAPQLKIDHALAVLGSSASEAVYTMSDGRMFSTQHSIEAESTFLAKKLNGFGVKSVAIVFKENQFSRAHEAAFRAAFSGRIYDTFAYNSEDVSELKTVALKIKQLNPEALYVPDAFPLMSGFLKELRLIGISNKRIYSVYSAQSDDVLRVADKDGEGLVYSYPDIGAQEALEHFPVLAAQILVQAAEICGDDVACIQKEITTKNSFDEHGVLAGNLTLKTIRDGKFVAFDG